MNIFGIDSQKLINITGKKSGVFSFEEVWNKAVGFVVGFGNCSRGADLLLDL